MVGLKSVWVLLISLFLFGACVPKSKQTECGSNEAFNSQLRTCVPIVQGPSAFINISSYSPLYTSTRYKNDTTPVTFTIAVSNPYNQTYTIEWEHSYNGLPQNLDGNVLTTSQFIPSLYSSNIGSNVITAKIISGGNVVDSHQFEVIIQNNPVPNINTGTIIPADYNPVLYGSNTGEQFSFIARNNGATGIGNYQVQWTLTQNGVSLPLLAETDTFANTATNGTNTFYYGTSGIPKFDPSTLGLGSYVLRARLADTSTIPETVVDEHQWNIIVEDPDFGFVSSAGSPFTGQDTIAFFGVSYDTYPFANSSATQSEFCVTVSDPDGAYVNGSVSDASNLDVVVRFYKDGGGSPIYEGATDGSSTPVKDTVCFNEASAAEKAALVFNDGSPTVAHYRSLQARVFDEQTGREICGSGLPSCPVTYPISWPVLVKPDNSAVIASFSTPQGGDNISYTSAGASSRTATVTQSASTTIRFVPSDGVVGYEGYDMTGSDLINQYFKYDVVIKKLGVTIATIPCKAFADEFPRVGVTTTQACTFIWPAFDPVTGAHLAPGAYMAYLQVEDTGSPIPGSFGATGNALTITATVSEPVNSPEFTVDPDFLTAGGAALVPPTAEGTTIRFQVQVTEDEHDTYGLQVEYCGTDALCSGTLVSAGSDTRVYGDSHYSTNTAITYKIPEDALGAAASGTVYFKFSLTDSPSDSSKASSPTPKIIGLALSNGNFVPALTAASATPAAGTYDVFAGNQFTASVASAISDASTIASEQTTTFQWWVGTLNDLNDITGWTAIEGATSSTLKWTPGPEITGTRYIAVCYSDGDPRVTANSTNAPDLDALGTYDTDGDGDNDQLCFSQWTINPKSNTLATSGVAGANGEVALFHVPAESIAYMAYAEDNLIHVDKVEYQADGTLGKPMAEITFATVSGTAVDSVKNLSLAASDTSLYVSYMAASSTAPLSFRAYVRRINISKDASEGGEKTATAFANTPGSKRKFGFSYTGYSVSDNCTASGSNCTWNLATTTMTFDGTPLNDGTDYVRITVDGVNTDIPVGIDAGGGYTAGEICGNCNANEQAESFAIAVNLSSATNIQGITAYNNPGTNTVVLNGMENAATEIFTSTQLVSAMGKILYNPNTNYWYLPVANAEYAGKQNWIQLLHGPDGDLSTGNMITNSFLGSDVVSAIDNAWSGDGLDMFVGYIRTTGGVARVLKCTLGASDCTEGAPITFLTGLGVESISLAGPISTINPYVYVASKDGTGQWWLTRLNAALTLEVSKEMETIGATATDTTILTNANVSAVRVEPAMPALPATTSSEGRVIVVSNNGGPDYNSYLFRWKTNGTVLSSTTTFDQDGLFTSGTSKIATFAPTLISLGDDGSSVGEKTNATMGVIRIANGEAEATFLNTDIESINSTTNDPSGAGNYRPPFVK